jgi:hypothetical protein
MNTRSGSSSTLGKPGTKPSSDPPTTRSIGYGILSRIASVASAATATSKPRIISSWGTAYDLLFRQLTQIVPSPGA